LHRFLNWDLYVTVSRSGYCIVNGELIEVNNAISMVTKTLKNNGIAIIDEFQRLPQRFWDILVQFHPSGRLILSGSSFSIVNKVFNRGVLYLDYFYHLGLI